MGINVLYFNHYNILFIDEDKTSIITGGRRSLCTSFGFDVIHITMQFDFMCSVRIGPKIIVNYIEL